MDPASARYTIRINGYLGDMLPSALPAPACHWQGQEAVLNGVLDQPRLVSGRATSYLLSAASEDAQRLAGRNESGDTDVYV
jgi:hypothetical protein